MSYPQHHSEMAFAKVNLALHLVERLPNGYHRLDSVAAFVEQGDRLSGHATADGTIRLFMDGPFSEGLPTTDNLVIRAAKLLQKASAVPLGAELQLEKNTPVGAGLGGGSADAAATLRLLNRLWNLRCSLPMLAELGAELGADVPACVFSQAARMEGIGDDLTPLPHLPPLPIVLAYPDAPLWTPEVYGAMAGKPFSGALSDLPRMGADAQEWLAWLRDVGNDLEAGACALSPHIGPMVEALAQAEGCVLARMSGSGSACFGLFTEMEAAREAAQKLRSAQPHWWLCASRIHMPI